LPAIEAAMPTNRTPINRPPRADITLRAMELFVQLQRCADRKERGRIESALHRELGLKLWELAVVKPGTPCPYSPGAFNYDHWGDAEMRWRVLEQATREMQRAAGTLGDAPVE